MIQGKRCIGNQGRVVERANQGDYKIGVVTNFIYLHEHSLQNLLSILKIGIDLNKLVEIETFS